MILVLRLQALFVLLLLLAVGFPASAAPPAAPGVEAAVAVAKCESANFESERSCYAAEIEAALKRGGAPAALALLDGLAARDPSVRRDGHMYAHHLGMAAVKSLDEVGPVFASCSPGWQSGCYHGVIQGYFILLERSGREVTTATLDALCGAHRAAGRSFLLFQCTHGLGHGLDILHRRDLRGALGACNLLSRADEREMCWAGAFMENVIAATDPHNSLAAEAARTRHAAAEGHGGPGGHGGHGGGAGAAPSAPPAARLLDPADLHYPCSALDPKYHKACYTIQTSAMLHLSGRDFPRVVQECGRAPETARQACFISLGRDVSTVAAGNIAEAVRLCGFAGESFRPTCHVGVVQSLVNINADPADGIPYCRAVAEAASKRACYAAVGLQSQTVPDGAAKRERACRTAEADQVDLCLGRPPAPPAPAATKPARNPG